jgi:hypothetical protein
MNRMAAFLLLALISISATADTADMYTGNGLLHVCKRGLNALDGVNQSNSNVEDGLKCINYLTGFDLSHDTIASYRAVERYGTKATLDKQKQQQIYCLPTNVTMGQVARVVVKYLENDPQHLHLGSGALVLSALIEAYPCKKK